MLNCREVTRLYSEAQERKLTLKERISLSLHVLMCTGCHNFGQQMQALRQIVRAYTRGENKAIGEDANALEPKDSKDS